MTPFFFFTIALPILDLPYFLTRRACKWGDARWRHKGEIVQARIVAIEMMKPVNRSIPFARLHVVVHGVEKYKAVAEGFYHPSELPYLHRGKIISVILHPTDKTKLKIVKAASDTNYPNETTACLPLPPKQKLSRA